MLDRLKRRIRWKCHVLKRIVKEKPKVLLRYARGWLLVRAILYLLCVIIYFVFSAILSAETRSLIDFRKLWEFLDAERLWLFCREIYGNLRQLNVEKIMAFCGKVWAFCKTIPSELRRGFSDFLRLLSEKRKLLWAFLVSLWPPSAAWERLCVFCARHKSKLKNVAEKATGVLIAFAMLKLVVLFVLPLLPLLGLGALTFLGFDAAFLFLILLQWCISLVAPQFARGLRHKVEDTWKRLIPSRKRAKLEQKVEGLAGKVADKIEGIQRQYGTNEECTVHLSQSSIEETVEESRIN